VIKVLCHRAEFGWGRTSSAVSLSITLLNVRDCAHNFAIKALEYRNDLDAVGLGKAFSVCCQVAIPQNAEVQLLLQLFYSPLDCVRDYSGEPV